MEKKENKINLNEKEHKLKNANFIDSFKHAMEGLIYCVTTQSSIKKQLIIAVAVMIISLFYNLKTTEFLCLMFAVVFVIFSEMVNTAIETIVDLYVDIYHPKAKIAKDVGAGAVLLMSINSVVVAYFLFLKETDLSRFSESVFNNMVKSPIHLAFVGIMVTVIAVIAIIATIKKQDIDEDKKKFLPSVQSSIAAAIVTIFGLNTNNLFLFILSIILGVMVLESRVEGKMHKTSEVIFSACMGILIVLLVYGLTVFGV